MRKYLRSLGPAYAFSAALVIVCIIAAVTSVATSPNLGDWCAADEVGKPTVCFRNWVNAVGSILAVLVAAIAAIFAGGQMVSAARQARIATVPLLLGQFKLAQDLDRKLDGVETQIVSFQIMVDRLLERDPKFFDDQRSFELFQEEMEEALTKIDQSCNEIRALDAITYLLNGLGAAMHIATQCNILCASAHSRFLMIKLEYGKNHIEARAAQFTDFMLCYNQIRQSIIISKEEILTITRNIVERHEDALGNAPTL